MPTQKQYAAADAAQALLGDDMTGEPILWFPGGDESQGQTITAVVDLSEDISLRDQKDVQIDERGRRDPRECRLELSALCMFRDGDTFLVRGGLWCFRRVLGCDLALQTILIFLRVGVYTKRPRLAP